MLTSGIHTVFANRITGKELLADKFLETYAEVISEQNLTKEIWPVITSKFPAKELISLVEEYNDEQYCWDYAHMYEMADFLQKNILSNIQRMCGGLSSLHLPQQTGFSQRLVQTKHKVCGCAYTKTC